MTEPLLELCQLSCERDGRQLFSELDAQVFPGDILQIAGPNGSGKTSLLRMLGTLAAPAAGDIHWRGQPLAANRFDYLSHLLYLGHEQGIKRSLTPTENLRWYGELAPAHGQMSVAEALAAVGLAGFEDSPCYALSAGQQRRVALARLYLSPALVWLLDEPFTALDRAACGRLEALLADHARGGGVVLLSTHQPMGLEAVKTLELGALA